MMSAQKLVGSLAGQVPLDSHELGKPSEDIVASLQEALAAKLLAPSDYQAAVIVGTHGGVVLAALRQIAPAIRHFLVLESNTERARVLVENLKDSSSLDGVYVSDLSRASPGYSFEAYLEIAGFLVRTGARIDRTFLLVVADEADDQAGAAIVTALRDLFENGSRVLLDACRDEAAIPVSVILPWADYLAGAGEPLTALDFYYLLAKCVDKRTIAGRIAKLWIGLTCFEPLREWVPFLADSEADQARLREEIDSTIKLADDATRERFAANLAALGKLQPDLVRTLEAHQPAKGLFVAFLPDAPWLVSPRGVKRGEYPMLLSIEQGRIRQHTRLPKPTEMARLLEPLQRKTHDAVVLGSLEIYALVVCIGHWMVEQSLSNRASSIYALDRDIDRFWFLLGAADISSFVGSDRFLWFVGEDAAEQLGAHLESSEERPWPSWLVASDLQTRETIERHMRGQGLMGDNRLDPRFGHRVAG
ncbi:MAG: hypothetical protein V2A73_18005 [Pseudomonadota bacterium]